MALKDKPCPACGVVGSLDIEEIFYGKPLGSWSLAGVQVKFSGEWRPVLTCSACDLVRAGTYAPGRTHAHFPAA